MALCEGHNGWVEDHPLEAQAVGVNIPRWVFDQHGRDLDPEVRWGPPTLGLDLLLHGHVVLETEELVLPASTEAPPVTRSR